LADLYAVLCAEYYLPVGYLGDERVLLAQYEAEPSSFIVGSFIVYR